MLNSCKATGTCNAKMKKPPDNSVGMDKKRLACTTDKRKDILEKGKSKQAFQHNVKTEVQAGKPVKQAVAIAYSQRKDLLPTSTNKSTMQSYGIGTLKNPGNGDVNSPQEAKAIGNQKSGQSNNFSPSRSKS